MTAIRIVIPGEHPDFRTEFETSIEVAAHKIGQVWGPKTIRAFADSMLADHWRLIHGSAEPELYESTKKYSPDYTNGDGK